MATIESEIAGGVVDELEASQAPAAQPGTNCVSRWPRHFRRLELLVRIEPVRRRDRGSARRGGGGGGGRARWRAISSALQAPPRMPPLSRTARMLSLWSSPR